MMSAKQAVTEMMKSLPENATWDDIVEVGNARFGIDHGPEEDITQEEWRAAWVDELNRREADYQAGRAKMIPHDEFIRWLRNGAK